MKHKKIIKVITESYEEEQYMQEMFPGAWFDVQTANTVFEFEPEQEAEVLLAIEQYIRMKEK